MAEQTKRKISGSKRNFHQMQRQQQHAGVDGYHADTEQEEGKSIEKNKKEIIEEEQQNQIQINFEENEEEIVPST